MKKPFIIFGTVLCLFLAGANFFGLRALNVFATSHWTEKGGPKHK